jgi:hypothetical protein
MLGFITNVITAAGNLRWVVVVNVVVTIVAIAMRITAVGAIVTTIAATAAIANGTHTAGSGSVHL